ncbi:MAG: hypothetical protein JXB17_03870, partial [Bacteroidales bacterium]|nr:hypothetical protein [Bacteroidales bacterium]
TLIYSVLFNSWSKKDLVYPLHELLDNMRKTGEGVINAYSIVRSNDEIGELTEGYNEMVDKIQKYISEVKKMNEELEDKVKVRTKEIEQQKEEIEAQRDSLKELNEELEQQKFELETTLENLKTAQDQLVEAEKMASLGNLVAGIAHELNTPVGIGVQGVSGIVNRTNNIIQLMESNKMKKSDLDSYLKYINESGKLAMSNLLRTSDLIKGFKQVSVDQSTEEKRKFALKNYMQDVINTIYPKFKKRKIEVIVNCDEKLQVESYPGAIAQILTNLIINSLNHAFSENDEGKIEIIIETGEKGVKLIYKDNGKGMNEEVKSKIFDPFFTTNKKVGTGLGMHIVYNLVTQKLFGDIKCKSAPGKGVEFTISLPQLKNKK